MKFMKTLIITLVLVFNFQSWTKANDLRDFVIEGMSIGDSLLDYFSEEEIISNINKKLYPGSDEKFSAFFTRKIKNYKLYDYLRIHFLTEDRNFIIYGISGMKDYKRENMQKCYDLQRDVERKFDKLFSDYEKSKDTFKSMYDETGKSKITSIYYDTKLGQSKISCYHFSEYVNYASGIDVTINRKEFSDWLISIRN